ncbi:MAG: YhdP family protein [Alcanivorax sp.]|nr:YhdP family protein [Alcanivorax sp.]
MATASSVASRRHWRHLESYLLWLVAVVLLLLAAYAVIGRQLMELVPEYRARLETLIEQKIKTPLTIADLQGSMDGLTPRFVARQIRLPAPEGEAPLVLDQVTLNVDVLGSLLHRELVLQSLSIRGIDLQLVRDPDGRIHLRGLGALGSADPKAKPPVQQLLRLFYRQQHVTIDDAHLMLAWPGLPPLASSLNASLINHGDEHQLALRLEARDRPLKVDARVHLHGDAYRWQQVDADIYGQVKGQRLQEWLPSARHWPLDVKRLGGAVDVWASLRGGQPDQGQLRLQLPALTLAQGRQQWPLKNLQLSLALQRHDQQARLVLSRLAGQSPAGTLAVGRAALQWQTQGESRQWRLRANDLSLQALASQFLRWPFALPAGVEKARDKLARLKPTGLLKSLYVSGHASRPEQLQARFVDLTSQADGRIPGVDGLSGWLAGGPDGGVAQLQGQAVRLNLPRLYDHALTVGLNGRLAWQRSEKQIQIRTNRLQLQNQDARGEAMAAVTVVPGQIPDLRLAVDIHDGNGDHANRYIPLRRLPDKVAGWLGQAIQGGHLQRGQILYQGPVKIDKRRQQDRTLQMRYQGDGVALSFLPDWPAARDLQADVLINGRAVSAYVEKGRLFNSQLSRVYVDVPEEPLGQVPHVIISGQVDGPLKDLDALFQTTPLHDTLPAEVTHWRFTDGQMAGHLLLDIPLAPNSGPPAVVVDAQVNNGAASNADRNLAITHIKAPVYFHLRDGMQMETLSADTFGGHFSGQWLTRDGHSQLILDGQAPVSQVRQWLGFKWLEPLTGTMPLGLKVEVPWQEHPFSLQAVSSLKGVTVAVPAPLGKAADETRPLQVSLSDQGKWQRLTVHYGDQLNGVFRLGQSVDGELLLGAGQPSIPARGIAVRGRVGQAAMEPWLDYLSNRLIPAFDDNAGPSAAVDMPSTSLSNVVVKVAKLDLFGAPVTNTTISAAPQGDDWHVAMSSQAVAGSVRIPAGFTQRGDKPLDVSISKLHVTLPDDEANSDQPGMSPLQVPVMNARVQDVVIDGENYGQWRGDLRATNGGVRIDDLHGQWRHTDYDGTLDWTAEDDGQYTRYNGSLKTRDLGQALQDWDLPRLIESRDGSAKVVLGWHNWPFSPDYLAMEGQANVDIGECRIPDTDTRTSFLRVLGILNIGTIQRRLRLDFSDLYRKGLSCDGITGDFSIDGPKVSTTNLSIESPSAAILVKGEMNLDKETLNHSMKVTLPISSNLYAGCLAGPAACAGIFVVERIWGDKLDKTTSMQFKVTGNWEDPKVEETEGLF